MGAFLNMKNYVATLELRVPSVQNAIHTTHSLRSKREREICEAQEIENKIKGKMQNKISA